MCRQSHLFLETCHPTVMSFLILKSFSQDLSKREDKWYEEHLARLGKAREVSYNSTHRSPVTRNNGRMGSVAPKLAPMESPTSDLLGLPTNSSRCTLISNILTASGSKGLEIFSSPKSKGHFLKRDKTESGDTKKKL